MNDKRGLAPVGWHIPTIYEFETFLKVILKDGNSLKAIGQGTESGIIENSSGFSSLFAGRRIPQNDFILLGKRVCFWSSMEFNPLTAYDVFFSNDKVGVRFEYRPKECGHSVRCLMGEKDTSEIKPKYKAVLDTTFDNGSKIIINELTSKEVNDLTVLGKLWGFLKYYHPMASKGDINWDYELFRIMPTVLKSNSKEERNKIFLEWINSLGGIKEKQEPLKIDPSKIKLMPDLKWTQDESELGKEITSHLKEITIAKRDSNNYYLGFYDNIAPTFGHEHPYKKMTFPDTGFRLLTLYRYWNSIQYYFPYKYLIGDDWNQVLRDFIPKFIKASNALDFRLTIHKLIAKINDSHGFISGNERVLSEYLGKYRVACNISFIENKAVVTEIYTKLDSTVQLKIGDIILKVNGESVDEIVQRKLPIYPASNHPTKLRNIAPDILRSNNESISVTFSRQGEIKTENIKGINAVNISTMPKIQKKSWAMFDNNIGYIYTGTINNSELPEIMKSFQSCKGIIIDLRCYPSDNLYFLCDEYLLPAPVQHAKFSHTTFEMPGLFFFENPQTVGKNNPDYYKGKIIIIVNETSQSSAEYHAMQFKTTPRATIIGSTTAGADGDIARITLPGGINTSFSSLGVYYPDGRETQRVGIVPDIEVKPTIKGTIEGRDELLEKAIQIIINEK